MHVRLLPATHLKIKVKADELGLPLSTLLQMILEGWLQNPKIILSLPKPKKEKPKHHE